MRDTLSEMSCTCFGAGRARTWSCHADAVVGEGLWLDVGGPTMGAGDARRYYGAARVVAIRDSPPDVAVGPMAEHCREGHYCRVN